jgi:hypothetical protein
MEQHTQGSGESLRRVSLRHGLLHSVEWLAGPLCGKKWYYDKGVPHRPVDEGPAVVFPDNSSWWVTQGRVVKVTPGWLEVDGPPEMFFCQEAEQDILQLVFDFYQTFFFDPVLPQKATELYTPRFRWIQLFFAKLGNSVQTS